MSSPAHAHIYWEAFRNRVFELISRAHACMRCEVGDAMDEPEITGRVAQAVQAILMEDDTYRLISVHEDEPLNQSNRFGKQRLKPDLKFTLTVVPRPQFIFEAKRLRMPDKPITIYLGQEGLGRFLDNRYPCPHDEGGMMGYVQTHSCTHWLDQIHVQYPLQITDNCAWSTHERQGQSGDTLRIYHLLLDFTSVSHCT